MADGSQLARGGGSGGLLIGWVADARACLESSSKFAGPLILLTCNRGADAKQLPSWWKRPSKLALSFDARAAAQVTCGLSGTTEKLNDNHWHTFRRLHASKRYQKGAAKRSQLTS